MRLDEHPHHRRVDEILGRRLAVRPVVTHPAARRLELGEGVTGDHAVELGVAERAGGRLARLDQQLGPDVGPVDDGGEGHRRLGPDARRQALVHRHRAYVRYQSSGSMNRWIVPPQVRPTAKASSSE